ncbi:MAG TPA: hypothetical protein VHP63_00290, partial [candidate division Zixibacteria bacterium]|nr:hypothetical protein [candidate division Zixibacteria bacterium]
IDAGTGAVLSASADNAVVFANPIIDVNLVYSQGTSKWSGTSQGGDMTAYNKLTGAQAWVSEYYIEPGLARYFANGALTCEPEPAVDIIVNEDEKGILHFWNSLDGTELFRRRWDYGGGTQQFGNGTAIGLDSAGAVHVLGGAFRGSLVSLSKGVDRPRLEIQDIDPNVAVEFSVSTSVLYTVPNIIVNTGCSDLLFEAVNVDEVSFGPTDPGISPFVPVRPEIMNVATALAGQMTSKAALLVKEAPAIDARDNSVVSTTEESFRNERGSRAALSVPVYLNSVVEPFVGQIVAAGDSSDLVMDVDPSQINRGPQTFYIELDTDDPDYFLNAGSPSLPNANPELIVTLVGGCLTDTTALEFGVGGANYQWVTNTGRLADGDWSAHGFEIDGEDAYWYQGSYVFGVSVERIAFASADWSGATGQEASWISIQGDPNYCDNDCKPALSTGVSLGAIWNGATYTPILGNLICKTWIDSVQDFGLGVFADWNWHNFDASFDDTLTMGLMANTRTVGALDIPELANLTVEIFEVTERNGGNVDGWKFGENVDYDLATQLGGTADTAVVDRNISAAWTTSSVNASADYAYGSIKLPFGCGYEPLKNAKGLDADQGHFIGGDPPARGDGYMDSAYIYMSLAPGGYSHVQSAGSDQQIHITFIENDFGPNETLEFGVAHFGYNSGISDPWAPGGGGELAATAHLVNKWVGFGRGDVNDDEAINLGDIMTLADIVGGSVPGAIPFEHLGDVDADNDVDNADLNYLINYYFGCGPCPLGDWQF